MGNIPSLSAAELCKIIERKGFELKRVKGSHHFYQHPVTKKFVTVPIHRGDLPKGTMFAILKQAGIDKHEI